MQNRSLRRASFGFDDYLDQYGADEENGRYQQCFNICFRDGGSKMKDLEGMIDEKALDRTRSDHSFHDT